MKDIRWMLCIFRCLQGPTMSTWIKDVDIVFLHMLMWRLNSIVDVEDAIKEKAGVIGERLSRRLVNNEVNLSKLLEVDPSDQHLIAICGVVRRYPSELTVSDWVQRVVDTQYFICNHLFAKLEPLNESVFMLMGMKINPMLIASFADWTCGSVLGAFIRFREFVESNESLCVNVDAVLAGEAPVCVLVDALLLDKNERLNKFGEKLKGVCEIIGEICQKQEEKVTLYDIGKKVKLLRVLTFLFKNGLYGFGNNKRTLTLTEWWNNENDAKEKYPWYLLVNSPFKEFDDLMEYALKPLYRKLRKRRQVKEFTLKRAERVLVHVLNYLVPKLFRKH